MDIVTNFLFHAAILAHLLESESKRIECAAFVLPIIFKTLTFPTEYAAAGWLGYIYEN